MVITTKIMATTITIMAAQEIELEKILTLTVIVYLLNNVLRQAL
jgi:hypothetical protein